MDLGLIVQLLVSGALTGLLFALISLGLSIIWGVSRIINIAHGEFVVLGSYITYFLATIYRIDVYVSSLIAGLIVAGLGMVIQYVLYNRIRGEEHLITLIITFGVSIVLVALMIIFFTADFRFLSSPYRYVSIRVGSIVFTLADIIAAIISIAVIGAISYLLYFTELGRAIRAVAQDREAALLMGIDEERVYVYTMGISAFSAGLAGGVMAVLYAFTPYAGARYLALSFAITIFGGLGSIPGVLVASLVVGITRAFTTLIKSGMEPAVAFIIIIIVMVIRPKGLFGRYEE